MTQPPRNPKEPVINRGHWMGITVFGIMLAISVLTAFIIVYDVLEFPPRQAVTVTFISLSFAQLWHVFNFRAVGSGMFKNVVTRNPLIWVSVLGCMLLIVIAVFTPVLAGFLSLQNPGLVGWSIAVAAATVPLISGQIGLQVFGVSINNDQNTSTLHV